MEGKDFCCYEFNEFRLDARRRSLTKNGGKIPLSPRNFDLLLFMVENGGRILEHDELLDKVWAGTFVEQATLKKGISALRHILAENPENEFIQTIPRRGYSFVSPIRTVPQIQENYLIRETEREIIVEEFEETDNLPNASQTLEETFEKRPAVPKTLPFAEAKKNNIPRLIILSVAGIAVLIVAFFGFKPYFAKTVKAQFSVENTRVTRITNSGNVLGGVAVSPDGTCLLYTLAEKEGVSLWIRQMSVNSTNRLTPPVNGGFWGFVIAPDNGYIYYIINNVGEPSKSGLYKVPLFGGEAHRIKENVSSVAIAPDGKRLALVRISGETRIFTTNTDGDDEREVTVLPGDSRLWGMSWIPDGKALLCTIRKTVDIKSLFYISEITPESGKEVMILPPQNHFIFGSVWLPDKSAVMLTMREMNADIRQIWQYFPDSQEWKRVTNDNNSYKLIDLARDGKIAVSNQESRLVSIWISDEITIDRKKPKINSLLNSSGNFRQITSGVGNFDRIGWIAGGRLIYSATEDGKETIFTINGDGANARQLTEGEDGIWIFPQSAGNGQSVGFLSSRAGVRQVWRIDADGKNPKQMTDTNLQVTAGRILRDNETVIFSNPKDNKTILFKKTADGQLTQLTRSETGYFAVSPDEKLLAAETKDENTGNFKTELISLEDGKTITNFNIVSAHQMLFTPDSKNLSYDETRGDVGQIMIQPLDGTEPFALTDFQTDEIFSFDWSPEGNRLAVIRGKQLNDAVLIKSNSR